MPEFKGVDAAIEKLRKHRYLLPGKIAHAKRALVTAVWEDLVKNTPQWSGNLMLQWHVEVSGNRGSYSPSWAYLAPSKWTKRESLDLLGSEPRQRGSSVQYKLQEGYEAISNIKWNSKVVIRNTAPYASQVEAGEGPLGRDIREVNIHPNYAKVAMVAYVVSKYKLLKNTKRFAK